MSESNKKQQPGIDREDEISAAAGEKKDGNMVDALKTGSGKQKRYFDKPFDEQMYDSLDDLKEQNQGSDE